MALPRYLIDPEDQLAEEVDRLLNGDDVPGVAFFTHVNQWGSYVEGLDQEANMVLLDLDSDGALTLLRIVLALRNRNFDMARELATKFFGALEDLAAEAIKNRSEEDY